MAVLDLQGMEAKPEHGIMLANSQSYSTIHPPALDDLPLLIRP